MYFIFYQGKFSDIKGRKNVLVASLVCTGLAYFLSGQSQTLLALALTRIPVGIFKQTQGLCKVSLADVTPNNDRPKIFGYFNSLGSAGFVVGPLIGGHIGMKERGFMLVMSLQCIGFLSMAAFAWLCLDVPDNGQTMHEEVQLKNSSDITNETTYTNGKRKQTKSFTSKILTKIGQFLSIASLESIIDLLLLRFILGFSMIIFRSNFSTMLEFRYKTSPKTTGYIMSFNGLISGFSGTLVGYIVAFYNHNDAKAVFHFAITITTVLFFITLSSELWVVIALLTPLSLATSVCRVCVSNLTLNRCRQDEKGVIFGVGNSMLSFARMLSPLLAGFALEYSMYGPGSLSVGIASIGIMISGLIVNS